MFPSYGSSQDSPVLGEANDMVQAELLHKDPEDAHQCTREGTCLWGDNDSHSEKESLKLN